METSRLLVTITVTTAISHPAWYWLMSPLQLLRHLQTLVATSLVPEDQRTLWLHRLSPIFQAILQIKSDKAAVYLSRSPDLIAEFAPLTVPTAVKAVAAFSNNRANNDDEKHNRELREWPSPHICYKRSPTNFLNSCSLSPRRESHRSANHHLYYQFKCQSPCTHSL